MANAQKQDQKSNKFLIDVSLGTLHMECPLNTVALSCGHVWHADESPSRMLFQVQCHQS